MMIKKPDKKEVPLIFNETPNQWTFYEIPKLNMVLGMKIRLKQISTFQNEDGSTYMKNGKPALSLKQTVDVKHFSIEEYKKILEKQESKHFK